VLGLNVPFAIEVTWLLPPVTILPKVPLESL
jgi:hypothetical protein